MESINKDVAVIAGAIVEAVVDGGTLSDQEQAGVMVIKESVTRLVATALTDLHRCAEALEFIARAKAGK
jgi:hypothetical protein